MIILHDDQYTKPKLSISFLLFLFIQSGKTSLNSYPQIGESETEDTPKQWSKQKQESSQNLK